MSQKTSPTAATQTVRVWTNASGTHRAQAALLRIEGETLWLRTADSRTATTTMNAISDADRQYVAAYKSSLPTSASQKKENPVSNLLGKVPSLSDAADWLQKPQAGTPQRTVPAALVYVRMSRGFIEDYVERTVSTRKPVRDCVLGTRIVGESHTVGKTQVVLLPSNNKILGEIGFNGTVHSRTTGYNGPAIFQFKSQASFRARKPVSLGDAGLNVAPATAVAPTKLQTLGVHTTLPRLRGRIATRIATRRNASARPQAEAITSRHSAATIQKDFDKRIDRSVAKIRRVFNLGIPGVDPKQIDEIARMRYRSTTDYVEMAMIRQGATAEELSLRPPRITGDPDFAIRINRNLFGTTIADADLSQQLAPILVQLLEARFAAKALAIVTPGSKPVVNPTQWSPQWSLDDNWLTLEFTDADRLPPQAKNSQLSAN